jgi:hypothetical protein
MYPESVLNSWRYTFKRRSRGGKEKEGKGEEEKRGGGGGKGKEEGFNREEKERHTYIRR